jgi:hypothetical protein
MIAVSTFIFMRCLLTLTICLVFMSFSISGFTQQGGRQDKTARGGTGKHGRHSLQPTQHLPSRKDKTATANLIPAPESSAITIQLRTSREQPGAGSDFGITADIENISDKAVYLTPRAFTMTAPPELDSEGPRDWYAWFPGPGEGLVNQQKDVSINAAGITGDDPYWTKVVLLAPRSKISAFWSGNVQPQRTPTKPTWAESICSLIAADCSSLFRNISFPPGKYKIRVIGAYWETYEGAKEKSIERRSQIADIDVPIVASQATILFGACFGGVISYLLLPGLRLVNTVGVTSAVVFGRKHAAGLLTSLLLSVIVTILLARLSETQFLIKVSVSDFWGAITMGFIGSASGVSIIRKIVPGANLDQQRKSGPNPVEANKTALATTPQGIV